MKSNDSITLSTIGEGPCAASLGLYELLDNLCDRFNYYKGQIYIETTNLLEQHSEYNIIKIPQMYYLDQVKTITVDNSKQFDSNFKHFGNFIFGKNRSIH